MRPAADLAEHAPRLRGVFCDVDDTLTDPRGTLAEERSLGGAVAPEAFTALCAMRDAGLRVVPVTGRPAGFAAVIAATWPVDAAVGENGAVAFVRRGAAVERMFYADAAERVGWEARLRAVRDEVLASAPGARLAGDQWLRLCDVAFDVGETQALSRDEIAAIVARIEAAGARAVVSTVHAHAFLGDHDKAKMCARLMRDLWREDPDRARGDYLYVGDSPNDAACFSFFPLSAGVANVRRFADRLDPPPRYVASAEGGRGFAEIAAVVLAGRS